MRYPGFAFINVQSPCVTYGQPERQLKVHKSTMKRLAKMGHDATDRLEAMRLAAALRYERSCSSFVIAPSVSTLY
jgi:2-oxoglutarate ferredoxin oxidoreductase subunit beta